MDHAEINELMVELSTDPEFQPLLRSGSAVLLWRAAPLSILWASPAAEELAQALVSDDAGTVSYSFSAHSQISALAEGRAPRHAHRLEKMRFESSALAPLSTCACRMIALPDGQEVLLTSFLGMPPRLPPHMRKAAQTNQEAMPVALSTDPAPPATDAPPEVADQPELALAEPPFVEAAPEPLPAPPPAAKPAKRIVRFVWEADADGRFVSVSDNLAEVVGADSAAIVGMTISDVLATRAHDPLDIVAELFARGETWSGRKLYWRIDESSEAVQIDLAGMTVHDRARNLVGFRGFGLCRTDIRIPWASPDEEAAEESSAEEAQPGKAPSSEAASSEAASSEAPWDAHPAAAIFEAASPVESQALEAQVAEAEPVAAEERSDPQQQPAEKVLEPAPEEAPEPAEPAPARMAFFTMGGSVGASMGDAAPLPLKVVEDEPASEAAATPEEATPEKALSTVPDAKPATQAEPPSEHAPAAQMPREVTPVLDEIPADQLRSDEDGNAVAVTAEDVPAAETVAPPKPIEALRSSVKPLSNAERSAFREIAKALGARFEDEAMVADPAAEESAQIEGEAQPNGVIAQDTSASQEASAPEELSVPEEAALQEPSDEEIQEAAEEPIEEAVEEALEHPAERPVAQEPVADRPVDDEPAGAAAAPDDAQVEEPVASAPHDIAPDIARVLDRLPFGVIVHRGETALFANRAILDLIGYADLDAFVEEGGLPRLFQARPAALAHEALDVTAPLAIGTRTGDSVAVEVRLATVGWGDAPASMLTLRKVADSDPDLRLRAMELDMLAREERLREQSAILDTATDGVIVLDDRGRILSLNRAAEALFGYEQNEVAGEPLMLLLATESHLAALDYLEGMRGEGMQSLLNDGREVIARVRQGGTIPLFMTLGRVGNGGERKFCAVLRDITAFKKAEGELIAAKRAAEHANAQKSDFLAKISHEIRTPLNAIIGFAEVMIEERFGAIGNERYKDYVSDIHSSGQHVISLVNDLLDLAKIEAGRMELTFTSVKVNELVTACVALLQPQAARDRIVLRTSFADRLPPVVADERSLRQITLNLLSNAVKFTDAGGQVIVSTAMTDAGEVVFRVRDTGIGMSETEVEAALEPFRQLATSRKGGGTGLGLPLTKALVEANRGALTISSRKNEGTLVEVVFPPTRVLAE